MKKKWTLFFLLTAVFSVTTPAEHTRYWRQNTYDELLKGTFRGIALRSDGRLELAPKFTLLADADASYLWAFRVDAKGTLFAAAGSPAKVIRFDAAGKATTVFQSTELAAQALAFDGKGNVFVATSPDGKVYRVSASGEKSVFFDPKTKYIWDLAFAADGTLYVATGDKGQIFSVLPDGKSSLFYSSDEAHIRVLAFDSHGNLIAGTEPNGRILRISRPDSKNNRRDNPAQAEGFVLYETSKHEVTSLAIAADGTIYVSAIGEKQRVTPPPSTGVLTTTQGNAPGITGAVAGAAQGVPTAPFVGFAPLVSSSIYRFSASGAPEELWTSREELVYSVGLAADGRLLAGTGNNGTLLAIDARGVFSHLAKAGAAQITGVARGWDGKIFLCTANPGKVFSVGPDYEPEGSYESRSFDAQLFSQWGRIQWFSPSAAPHNALASHSKAAEARVEFFVRSGNTEDPGKEWSAWSGPYTKGYETIQAPSARFVQWKAIIHGARPGDGIDWVSLAYLPRNVAPVIDGIVLQQQGIRVQEQQMIGHGQPAPATLKMPQSPASISSAAIFQSSLSTKFEAPPQGTQQKGYQTVIWSAHDENEDDLRYAVYYRGENEREWKLLKDKLEQKFYSWDTTALPDGAYYVKIVASDLPSNPPDIALTTERASERFEVDNTPPVIEGLQSRKPGEAAAGVATVSFTARDANSSIDHAQYSIDGGDWVLIAPVGAISDALEERYTIQLSGLAHGEHTITVRAFDRFDNVGSAKITLVVQDQKQ